MGILLILATILWLKIDPTKQLIPTLTTASAD